MNKKQHQGRSSTKWPPATPDARLGEVGAPTKASGLPPATSHLPPARQLNKGFTLTPSPVSRLGVTLRSKGGFTLIELLVVIAIIGILSSVVLTSLGNARNKGADTGIIANLSSIRTQFEVDYDPTSSGSPYGTGGNCSSGVFASGVYEQAIDRANALSSDDDESVCKIDGSKWAVAVLLKSNENKHYCVDSAGNSGTYDAPSATIPSGVASNTACE